MSVKNVPPHFFRLTAFVLRSFSQAREFIFVDDEELNSTFSWIASKQLDTGCFRKHGKLFNKGLKVRMTLQDKTLTILAPSKCIPLTSLGFYEELGYKCSSRSRRTLQ